MKISKLTFYLSKLKNILLINKDFYNQFFFPSATLERDDFIKKWILNLPKKSKLLDAGAGIQRYKKFTSHLEYTSQDFGEYTGASMNPARTLGPNVASSSFNPIPIYFAATILGSSIAAIFAKKLHYNTKN